MIKSPTLIGWMKSSESTPAVSASVLVWRWHAMAPVMSIKCITVPPRMNPRGLESFGSTTWTVSAAESCQRFALKPSSPLPVVADPHRELGLAEPGAAARHALGGGIGPEHDVFPLLVQQRLPRPVEVDGEAERERGEADAIRRARIDKAQPRHRDRGAEHRRAREVVEVNDWRDRLTITREDFVGFTGDRRWLIVETRGAEPCEQGGAHSAEHADRRRHRVD